jgi:uncharacterized protein (TIGR03435 family)
MTLSDLWASGNHLWQSTAFAAVAWLVTLLLRKNSARVRHAVWFVASVKFLVPISWLIDLGGRIHWRSIPAAQPAVSLALDRISQSFSVVAPLQVMPTHAVNPLPMVLFVIWAVGAFGLAVSWMVRYWRIRACARSASALPLDLPVSAMSSRSSMEPGVFGILRPVLLLPEGIFERLTEPQLSAVIEHELCHVRHRDNLVASIQMFVETVFWFHPLVWWIGKRMVAERELACDEEVLRRGNARVSYAEGILSVCKLYAESPLACASGVTGADLKKRIRAIIAGRMPLEMTVARKTLLVVACLAAFAAPLIVGVVHAADPALAFEAVSIKPSDPNGRMFMRDSAGQMSYANVTVKTLILSAYQIRDFQLSGGPAWIASSRYDVTARVPSGSHVDFPADPMTATDHQRETFRQQRQAMVRAMLADRFGLVIHKETRELPVYALTVAKDGPKFRDNGGKVSDPDLRPGMVRFNNGIFIAPQASMGDLVQVLSEMSDRTILDRTGLNGKYDLELKWSPNQGFLNPDDTGSALPDGPSLFTALREQLGLRLDPSKGPVETVVIDRVETPSEN